MKYGHIDITSIEAAQLKINSLTAFKQKDPDPYKVSPSVRVARNRLKKIISELQSGLTSK